MASPSAGRLPSPSSDPFADGSAWHALGQSEQAHADALDQLVSVVQACRACPAMDGQLRVFSSLNGSLDAPCVAIAEAPGRRGAGVTGIPLSGDQAGRTFRAWCAITGVDLSRVFLTNAVLCNPLTAAGTNRLPSTSELATCRQHLRATLAILRPRLVVTLGATALASLGAIAPHGLTLRLHVAQAVPWQGGLLLPLYHPGARACVHRPADQQLQDYVVWADLLRGLH